MKFAPANIVLFVVCLASYLISHGQQPEGPGYLKKLFKTYKKVEVAFGCNFQTSDYKGSKETRRYYWVLAGRFNTKGGMVLFLPVCIYRKKYILEIKTFMVPRLGFILIISLILVFDNLLHRLRER